MSIKRHRTSRSICVAFSRLQRSKNEERLSAEAEDFVFTLAQATKRINDFELVRLILSLINMRRYTGCFTGQDKAFGESPWENPSVLL